MSTSKSSDQTTSVSSFKELIHTPFSGEMNAIGWKRALNGDFNEIVNKIELNEHLQTVSLEELCHLKLTKQGELARDVILEDFSALKKHGADPVLNMIKNYERDVELPFFPVDVYSFHVDRSPVPTDTFLCTYFGASSEIIPNSCAEQKILVPEIREELKKHWNNSDNDFDAFLTEYYFDLHYQAKSEDDIKKLGNGNLWRLTTDHPNNPALPCIHRAPQEKKDEPRLMIIC